MRPTALTIMNRRASAFLAAVLLAASASAGESDWSEYERLRVRFEEAVRANDLVHALETAGAMNDIVEPEHMEILFGIARLHALRGDKPAAYAWLDRAVGAGYWNAQLLRSDEAFAGMREEQLFRELVRAAWANGYIAMLERPEREEFQKPAEVLAAFELREGLRVADIGSGSGYFTIPVAKAVGPTGNVLAVDASQEMIDYLERRVRAEGLANVKLQKVGRTDPELPPAGMDLILMIDTIHYVQDRAAYCRKLREGLAPGGRVIIIDYTPKPFADRPWGPPPEQQVPREKIDEEMAQAGLTMIAAHDFLPEQYFVVYGVK